MDHAHLETYYSWPLVTLSITVAVLASYVALDLTNSISQSKGRARTLWLSGGSLAMGFGIWSMHFVGMLAFKMPGMEMGYDVPLLVLSILIAIVASGLTLVIVTRPTVPIESLVTGGIAMAAAIAGMHYVGMYAMRMPAKIEWNPSLVILSIFIALIASFIALSMAIRLRKTPRRFRLQVFASLTLGIAISGMHYTGMEAATFIPAHGEPVTSSSLLATSGLGVAVTGTTMLILAIALAGSAMDRALTRKTIKANESIRLFRETEKALVALREERELRERFVSALAHDLRTPLGAAKMSAQLAIRSADDRESVEALCSKAVENLRRIDHMIQDLLDANRISSGRGLPLHPEKVDLTQVAQASLDDLTTVFGDHFRLRSDGPLEGEWDPGYLRRMIENLCSNAVKYGSDSAPVTVELTKTEIENGPGAMISVHNEGAPLDPVEREGIFKLFHRSPTAERSRQQGWGIGLTIVKGIASAHGGSVEVESSTETGTTFRVSLPRSPTGANAI